jgi:hypothetical protein
VPHKEPSLRSGALSLATANTIPIAQELTRMLGKSN